EGDGSGDSGLHERGEKSECLEEHGLAAGVGPRDKQGVLVREHLQIEWNDVDALGDEQWVAAINYCESFVGIRELCRRAPKFDRVSRARHQRVENDERLEARRQLVTVRADLLC